MNITRKSKAALVTGAVLAIVGLGITPAMAEGSYSADFTNINPGFTSQTWTDHQNDTDATVIDFVGCYPSNGVGVSSLQVVLWDQWGIFPDAGVGPVKSTSGCGSFSWVHGSSSYTLRDSTFYWELDSINHSGSNRWMDGTADATY